MGLAQSWCHTKQNQSLFIALSMHACVLYTQWRACTLSLLKVTSIFCCQCFAFVCLYCKSGHARLMFWVYGRSWESQERPSSSSGAIGQSTWVPVWLLHTWLRMSMYSLLRSMTEAPTETEIEDNLAGNLWYFQPHLSVAMHMPACNTQ